MSKKHGFESIRRQQIRELNMEAELFRHLGTGAELLSLSNDDENKVFGIAFRTPPSDSTGVAHILEHSVLCGSRKYPVKEPFVELLKGSLQTFLNAMTFPDKTCYPVASQNVQDFYNLIDVYLDAVFYPRLTPRILQQEGWHFELEREDEPLRYKGVVYNEMKGAHSSPDNILAEYSRRSLFPDNTYGVDSGGEPSEIPKLTYEQFRVFHQVFYHPSNSRIFFYGDDDPEKRLEIVEQYLRDFQRREIDSFIPLQKPFERPKLISRPFAAGNAGGGESRGMVTVNWLLTGDSTAELTLAFHILEYILLGMPGSPLRKALVDSNLGEDLAGEGLGSDIRQIYFSTGLKGVKMPDENKVVPLVLETLERLSKQRIDPLTVEAGVNSVEFNLRENNTGHYPRGLLLMLRSLTTWLYDGDPLALIAFEEPLDAVKAGISGRKDYFEEMIERFFLRNPHRTTLVLKPDSGLAKKEEDAEKERLARARSAMSPEELREIIRNTRELKAMQERPDSPEALAKIPTLRLEDLDPLNKVIPLDLQEHRGSRLFYHDLFTNGIVYLDVGFDLHRLPQRFLPYVRLFGRALLEMGTEAEDYVSLSQRISRNTGGIRPAIFTSAVRGFETGITWFFLRGKAMAERGEELLHILRDILLTVRLDNRERFRQMILESKARQEQKLVPGGHQVVSMRLRARFNEADWAAEQMGGVEYLFFLRHLSDAVEKDWPSVLSDLQEMRSLLLNRQGMLLNITLDQDSWSAFRPRIIEFVDALPVFRAETAAWSSEFGSGPEALTIPAQINYVGKGLNLYENGYNYSGSSHVISRFLRNSYLWDRIRVQGGAYGAFCLFDRLSGVFSFVSYRDPNLTRTLEVFDHTAGFLEDIDLSGEELTKAIIGAIGDIDRHQLPDAKGFTSMLRHLSGETEKERQKMREQILGTTVDEFREFGRFLQSLGSKGFVEVLGSESAVEDAVKQGLHGLKVIKLL